MARKRSDTHPAAKVPRPARRIFEEKPGKLSGPTVCPDCGASYRNGRWTWAAAAADAATHVCPACERIATGHAAGIIHLEGPYALEHRDELLRLLRNLEARERDEHPLKRIMAVTDEEAGFCVTVTDAKLAQSFGRALSRSYQGALAHPPTTAEQDDLVRVHWRRD